MQERLPLTPATRQWVVWGTTARIVVTDPALADDAERVVRYELDRIDLACSRFRDDSELAGVQRQLAADPEARVPVSPLLADLIRAGVDAAARTGGDVDPTLADDLSALGYDRDFARLAVRGMRVRMSRRVRHDWRAIDLDDRDRLHLAPGVHLDLGATAKALAADRCAELVAAGLDCGVLVSLGGDITVAGELPPAAWQVLVQDGDGEPGCSVALFAGGLATSSTLSRTWRNGTRRVHHILDPASGRPAEPVWRTVTVVAGTCVEANMLATASIVRGWQAPAMLRAANASARLVGRYGNVVRIGAWPAGKGPAQHVPAAMPLPRGDRNRDQ